MRKSSNTDFPKIAFLVFRSRSGSTLIGDRINWHPNILVTPESEFVKCSYEYFYKKESHSETNYLALAKHLLREVKLKDWGLTSEQIADYLYTHKADCWRSVVRCVACAYRDHKKPTAQVVMIKKNSWNYRNIDRLMSLDNDVKSLWVVRDPRAVHNSSSKAIHSESGRPISTSALKDAYAWRDYIARMQRASSKWSTHTITVKYEEFLLDTYCKLTEIWEKLDETAIPLAQFEVMQDYAKHSQLITKATAHLHTNVTLPPKLDRISGWKNELPVWKALLFNVVCWRKMAAMGYL